MKAGDSLYGQTEGITILTKLPEDAKWNEPGGIGVVCRGMTAFIDKNNSELCFCGSSVSMGYAVNLESLQYGDCNNGFLRIGDTATIDKEGRIYLTGRLKRFLKLRGIRINMDDVERDVSDFFHFPVACSGKDNCLIIFSENACDIDVLRS